MKEKMTIKYEQSLSKIWDNFKIPNIAIVGVSERIMKWVNGWQISKSDENSVPKHPQRITKPKNKSTKKTTTRHMVIRRLIISDGEEILKATRKIRTLHLQGQK